MSSGLTSIPGRKDERLGLSNLRNYNAAEESLRFKQLDDEIHIAFDEEGSDNGETDPPDEPPDEWITERIGRIREMSAMGKKNIKASLSEIEFDIVGDRIRKLDDAVKMFRRLRNNTKISLRAI